MIMRASSRIMYKSTSVGWVCVCAVGESVFCVCVFVGGYRGCVYIESVSRFVVVVLFYFLFVFSSIYISVTFN